jgi:hypothetical protein
LIAPIISRLTQPLGGQKSPRETRNRNEQGHPIVASIIPGAISRAQVERNVSTPPPSHLRRLMAELKNEKLIRSVAPTPA